MTNVFKYMKDYCMEHIFLSVYVQETKLESMGKNNMTTS